MTEQEIEDFEDYLADVLCVWDCYEQERVTGSPLVLRFESVDVVADMEEGAVYRTSGSNEAIVETLSAKYMWSDSGEFCLSLSRDKTNVHMIGEKWTVAEATRTLKAATPRARQPRLPISTRSNALSGGTSISR